jgi:uncharacterized membrane protein YcaP (DUF421 family)
LGDLPLVVLFELVFRTAIMFGYAILLFRLSGARALNQLSLAEVVLIVGLGSAVGDPMLDPQVPLLHGMAVITVVVLLQRLLNWLTRRVRPVRKIVEPTVVCLVKDGQLDEKGMDRAHLSPNELYAELRQMGVENIADVKRAYMEPDGSFSVFQYEGVKEYGEDYDLLDDADRRKSA